MLEILVLGLLGYIVRQHVREMKRLAEEVRNYGKKKA